MCSRRPTILASIGVSLLSKTSLTKQDKRNLRTRSPIVPLRPRLRAVHLFVILPSDHRLAEREAISPQDLAGETFIGMADQAPVLRSITEDYIRRPGIDPKPTHRGEYLSTAISVVVSTRGVALLPGYARNFLTWSVNSRPLAGEAPSIDLVLGCHKANESPLLLTFISRVEEND